MKRLLYISSILAAGFIFTSGKPQAADREAFFQTNLHCRSCATKIQENVSFEKGVKDLEIDVDAKTVRIRYNPAKTEVKKLEKAIAKLGFKVELISDKSL